MVRRGVLLLAAWAAACSRGAAPPDPNGAPAGAIHPAPPTALASADPARALTQLSEQFSSAAAGRKEPEVQDTTLPAGLAVQGGCDAADDAAQSAWHAAASARVPLIPGLTLSSVWTRPGESSFEHECLIQVTSVDTRGIAVTQSCNRPNGTRYGATRVICGRDFNGARFYHPGWYTRRYPEAVRGSTMFTLSLDAFRRLKADGHAPLQYAEVDTTRVPAVVNSALAGTLTRRQNGTMQVIVNDQTVALPVIDVSGLLTGTIDGAREEINVEARILDEERLPIVLEYHHAQNNYTVKYTRISFPSKDTIEKRLSQDEPVDVYGIYFDFASDRIRPESSPVLNEIAEVLARHPDWRLKVSGHTDNVGGASANLDLSKRRAAAVREALMSRYGIDGARLITTGYGLSSPKDTNETAEGRARNRRVELARER